MMYVYWFASVKNVCSILIPVRCTYRIVKKFGSKKIWWLVPKIGLAEGIEYLSRRKSRYGGKLADKTLANYSSIAKIKFGKVFYCPSFLLYGMYHSMCVHVNVHF